MNHVATRPSLSYLLRLWTEEDGGQWVWRVSLTPAARQAEETRPLGFASLETAVAWLEAEMERLVNER